MAVSHTPLLVQIVRHPASTAVRRPPDRGEAEEIVAVTPVKADHLIAKARQVSRYVDTHVPRCPVTRIRTVLIIRRPAPRPAIFTIENGITCQLATQATAGMPGTDAVRKPQHARQLDVNLFSDVKKIRLRARNLTSEKILTCYRLGLDPKGRAAARPATPQAKRHWRMTHDHQNAWKARAANRGITGDLPFRPAQLDHGRGEVGAQDPQALLLEVQRVVPGAGAYLKQAGRAPRSRSSSRKRRRSSTLKASFSMSSRLAAAAGPYAWRRLATTPS